MNAQPYESIRIIILNSQTLVRAGLKLIINDHEGLRVVGEAGEAGEGLDLITRLQPDIVLVEFDPSSNINLEIIKKIFTASTCARVILLTRNDESQAHLRAVKEGVLGIVLKTQSPEILIKAIQKVHAGEVWIERSMIANLLSGLTHAAQVIAQDPETEKISELSQRERKVIQLIGQGLKNQQIARQLCLSETTVRHHLTSIYAKLGVSDRLELLVFAHRYRLD